MNEEVIQFKRLGRKHRVFALIVGGEPNAKDPAQECFPPALRFDVGAKAVVLEKPVELIAADAREHADGKDDAFIRLVAGVLGVGFDDLRQRERQRRRRRITWIALGAIAGRQSGSKRISRELRRGEGKSAIGVWRAFARIPG